ncbi:transcriptional regulator [Caldiplasma sukawensis]
MKNDKNKETIDSIIEKLSSNLGEPVLKSSQRLLIIIILSIYGRMRFYELQRTLGIGKGSLSNHLEKLQQNGIVVIRNVLTIYGPGKAVELSQKGKEIADEYSNIMSILFKRE